MKFPGIVTATYLTPAYLNVTSHNLKLNSYCVSVCSIKKLKDGNLSPCMNV